ncbi:MAG: hypothetical protein LKCHEGNO_03546 [Burkholderiaceae bacterium]|nr:hypothetical protein [Burkholderiaceae bacterium]
MSASLSARPGGQPSITQPIAGPWLSPKVVTRNVWPKVLPDMGANKRAAAIGCGPPLSQVRPGGPRPQLLLGASALSDSTGQSRM